VGKQICYILDVTDYSSYPFLASPTPWRRAAAVYFSISSDWQGVSWARRRDSRDIRRTQPSLPIRQRANTDTRRCLSYTRPDLRFFGEDVLVPASALQGCFSDVGAEGKRQCAITALLFCLLGRDAAMRSYLACLNESSSSSPQDG